MAASPIRLYYDLMSQPSRAIYMFLKLTKIPFDDHQIKLAKGIHLTDEFTNNVNRLQKVPALVDNEFKLSESVAMFRYLCARNRSLVDDHWYPKEDIKRRAKIDEYLDWQHMNTRMTCSYYFILKYLKPRTTGREAGDDEVIGSSLRQLEDTMDLIERLWLDDGSFLAGQKEISIADLLGASELEQPRVTGYEPGDGRPKIQAWLNRVREQTSPHYQDAHRLLYKLSDQSQNPTANAFTG